MNVKPKRRSDAAIPANSEMWKPHMSCPHCPSEELAVMEGAYEDGEVLYQVCCLECGAEGPHGETRKDACKLWDAKHGRHRIGERPGQPICAFAGVPVAAPVTAPIIASPAEIEKERSRKQRFFDLAGGLLNPGA
mgnify:FL=1